ncbi:fibroblast growth factor receptor 4-like isoform X2 [Ostrea edulis]|nr:fibroblast growth factor receptor 4-like isoform X2 [Ostrea edulis]
MCENLVLKPEIYSDICSNGDKCQKGCKVACHFKTNISNTASPSLSHWSFSMEPVMEFFKRTQKIEIAWDTPTSDQASGNRQAFVYVLMAKEPVDTPQTRAWTEVIQTASRNVVLKREILLHSSEFWLIAVTENGSASNIHFQENKKLITEVMYPPSASLSQDSNHGSSVNTPIQVNFSIVEDAQDTTLSALIQWSNPPIPLGPGDSYRVTWFMENCQVWEYSPPCDQPADHYAHTVMYSKDKEPFYVINSLMYNSLYNLVVDLNLASQQSKKRWYGKLNFRTELCEDVDTKTYTKCNDNIIDSKVGTDVNKYSGQEEEKETDPFVWYLHVVSMTYDVTTNRVTANVSWTVPFNTSHIKSYSVAWKLVNTDSYKHDSSYKYIITNQSFCVMSLDPSKDYEVSVVAVFKDFKEGDYIRDSESEPLIFNTTWFESMPETPRVGMSRVEHSQMQGVVDKVIYGIAMILSISLLGLIMLFVYKKRHSFKDIIITKTTVAKSNSYKSNVGCKVDYSNQLLVISDEWELDPRLLKFSSPIGQGAFGKVVTGYYENQRVAIKLVRDSAPLSYKEDLLAEINLMKRIGSHPNIVSMSGACTLSEPIALVMEYVPYGNLQNFLKKCRLEGDFQKSIGRSSEVAYSLMDENGGIDSGIITPADMLSFARQVAMAMEYLAAKKYVHRDLAARNILLGYDKVVKVCDFGLSRDIYNDNQYHKITSGKLPLKWMAIESLRDRIFTTQSDVWSFGILMWEIITMGGSPYPNIALADLYYVLANGYRMERPSNCSSELYTIMRQCWIEIPSERPNFTDLRIQIEQLLSRDRNYLDLDNIDAPLSTSESSSSPKSDDSDSMSLLNTRPSAHRVIPGQSQRQGTNSPSTSQSVPHKTVTIASDPVTVVCIENSDQWFMRGMESESST